MYLVKKKNEDRLSFYVIIRLLLSLSVGPQGKRLLVLYVLRIFPRNKFITL